MFGRWISETEKAIREAIQFWSCWLCDEGEFGMMNGTAVKRVGIIGGGQLAWMLADAAKKLDIDLVVQTPEATDPATAIAVQTILASVVDAKATEMLAKHCDVITFENEFVDLAALGQLANQGVCFRPSLESLSPLLNKYDQRCF